MPLPNRLRRLALRVLACGAIFAGAGTHAVAAPALWVVRSSTATVYLFGTVHNLPPDVNWRSPMLDRALASSQQIWTEADTGSLAYLQRLIRRYGLSQQGNLRNLLPRAYRARYEVEMSSAGLRVDQYGHIKPWLAQVLLDGVTLHREQHGFGVETALLAYARKHRRQAHTFESPDSQFAVLADMPLEAQIRALEMEIDGYPTAGGVMNPLVRDWLDGQDVQLDQITNQRLAITDERYFDDVIVRRDEQFADAIVTLLQGTGTSFVALGAAHLCGGTSVQAQLKTQGYTAERVGG
ncbi:MAG TPA: TraB/GumN family protein [Acetobacteraceae bacterium]|nr:TraB/GumN family protein [Acetobacteraceae bacterium]